MTNPRDPNASYAVGYRKPPTATRFKPGHSGNPKGRPKGALNLATILQHSLRERVTIVENGRRRSISKLEAAAKQLVNRAASGDYRALQMLLPQLTVVDASLTPVSLEERDRDDQAVMATLLTRFTPESSGEARALTPKGQHATPAAKTKRGRT